MEGFLDVKQTAIFDNSITSLETHSYMPYQNSFNNSDEIRIVINQSDLIIHPASSFLYIEGTFLKENLTVSTTSKLVNNAIGHLFQEIRYELNSTQIDQTKNLGFATTMKSYVSFNKDETLNHTGWNDESQVATNGNFNFCVPLKNLLGLCEDYKKVFINSKHELILIRSRNDLNAFECSAGETMKLTIDKIVWKMPHVKLSDINKLEILQVIESPKPIQVWFRSWEIIEYPVLPQTDRHFWTIKTSSQLEKPRFVILGFQTDRKNNAEKNASLFDHCNLRNVKLHLNSEVFPYENLNINYEKNQYSMIYDLYTKFQESYYNTVNKPILSYGDFKTKAPLCVLDCSRQQEALKTATVDVKLEFETTKNLPANTSLFALILHDKLIEYSPMSGIVRTL